MQKVIKTDSEIACYTLLDSVIFTTIIKHNNILVQTEIPFMSKVDAANAFSGIKA